MSKNNTVNHSTRPQKAELLSCIKALLKEEGEEEAEYQSATWVLYSIYGLTNNPVRAGKLRTLTAQRQLIAHDEPSVYTRSSVAPKGSC